MPEQITHYHDSHGISPFCNRVEIALLEAGARYTSHSFDIHNKPEWFARVNPLTGKIPVITYGGPEVPPEEPSPLSFKITESFVILEFLADLFPNSNLLPPASDPNARARVRFFIDVVAREVETPMFKIKDGAPDGFEKLAEGLEKIQALLPDPDATEGGEYAIGREFTNADCAIAPLLASIELVTRTDLGNIEPGMGKKFGNTLAGGRFDSVKKVLDLERLEREWREVFTRN
ncbi:hypothetical protein HD554DRAFT_1755811 [Boletus coccyginus]|nr:hypothetical protein HD554DRAFT_1755811 [Boletus coccyginus]